MAFQIPKEIAPQELSKRLQAGESIVMIDVREPEEWAAGHIAGAKHIQLGLLIERQEELDKNVEIILVCRSGNRSGLACELLAERGFEVVNLTGGLNAWTNELVQE